jgi:hypothetical protein
MLDHEGEDLFRHVASTLARQQLSDAPRLAGLHLIVH